MTVEIPTVFPSKPCPMNDYDPYRGTDTAIIIDNGSSECRFDNIFTKFKERKSNQNTVLVGNDVYSAGQPTTIKSAFDGGVVVNTDVLENTLDFAFTKLGIDTDQISHPVVMTEALCNPVSSRKLTSELLFECYTVPKIVYGVDIGHALKRLPYGGLSTVEFAQKVLQLKYPSFPHKINPFQIHHLVTHHAYVSTDYGQEIRQLDDPAILEAKDVVIQFPYAAVEENKTTAEDQEKLLQRRREQGRRLAEQAAKLREQKLAQKETQLDELKAIKISKADQSKGEFNEILEMHEFKSEADLDNAIKNLEELIRRARNRQAGIQEPEEKEVPSFPLVDIPDSQLTEEQKKEKRKQKLLKGSFEARERARQEREDERLRELEKEKEEEERRLRDPQKWLEEVHTKRNELVDKIRLRQRRKAQLSDRRSHASQLRMRSIAHLAEDVPSKRRRRGADEDTFGADDDDWAIYREISKEDSEEEDEDAQELAKLDSLLLAHDESFIPEDIFNENEKGFTNTIIHRLAHGVQPVDLSDPAQATQVHLNVERIRIPEVFFQPGIAGNDYAGVVETLNDILKRFDGEKSLRMAQNIFTTGGHSLFPHLQDRIQKELQSLRPYGSLVKVRSAADPLLDAWRGAALWAADSNRLGTSSITRAMYDEFGSHYLQRFACSNIL
ncbi:Nuclear actin-protein involved in chromatin remodeling [Quaeritorhiza haematococci]|nr:Nuclear actin-protein involved in chromatin remodeling [Quaeritorhiza haematococci]